MSKTFHRAAALGAILLSAAACSTQQMAKPPTSVEVTPMNMTLRNLPPPAQRLTVALYRFPDLTGQFKPSQTITSYSRAVTQGAAAVLTKALLDAGNGSWFTVVEREGLEALLKERAIIRETRQLYLSPQGKQLPPPPPLVYAGVLLEGGIVGYDSNTLTGGAGARYLGIGGSTEYREDTVTVSLRAISTQTGEVLKAVSAKKTILSYGLNASVFKFVAFRELLEVEAGYTQNEPGLIAVQQAIERAVYSLIVEGALSNLWSFADQAAGQTVVQHYLVAETTTPNESQMEQIQALEAEEPAKVKPRRPPEAADRTSNGGAAKTGDNRASARGAESGEKGNPAFSDNTASLSGPSADGPLAKAAAALAKMGDFSLASATPVAAPAPGPEGAP